MITLTEASDEQLVGPLKFTEPNLFIVEGRHDQQLINAMLLHLGVTGGCQVHSVNGKSKWHGKILAITKDDTFTENVRRLGLVRDADENGMAAWQSCVSALEKAKLPLPGAPSQLAEPGDASQPATVAVIVPSREGSGALEELLLPALDQDRMRCVNRYFECLAESSKDVATGGKAHLRVYLTGLSPQMHDAREALRVGHIDLDHDALTPIRTFVQAMVG